jgi:uncharacterized lipoprotein YddW (UPF0748 family)
MPKLRLKIILIFLFYFVFSLSLVQAEDKVQSKDTTPRGVWVSVFSAKKWLYSEAGVHNLISQCNKAKINEIYLQIFQSGSLL